MSGTELLAIFFDLFIGYWIVAKFGMSQYHPDKIASLGPELKEICARKTKEINTAYDRAMAGHGRA